MVWACIFSTSVMVALLPISLEFLEKYLLFLGPHVNGLTENPIIQPDTVSTSPLDD